MPYVIVDTNCLIRDYLLIEAHVQTFLRGCQRCHITVCFPEVVLDELVGNYAKDIARLTNEHYAVIRKLQRLGVQAELKNFNLNDETLRYRRHVQQVTYLYDVRMLPYPNLPLKTLVEASYSGRKPFKDSGDGFKDFLIFESLRSFATKEGGEGWFITSNSKDFCDADGQLHSDLKSALPNTATLTVFRALHDFNATVLSPRLEVLEVIATRVKSGDFEGFDLGEGLTNLFIAELCEKYHPIEETGTPLDEPTAMSVYEPKTEELIVSRLAEDRLLFELSGTIELELSGFIAKSDLYAMSDVESEGIHIDDPDWNEWVASAGTVKDFHFSMTVIFDETKRETESVSIELNPPEDAD